AREAPGSFDALFLLNVERPDFPKLASVLDMGKPVFLFLGNRILPEVYNRFSGFPWQIRKRIDLSGGAEKINLNDSIQGSLPFLKTLEKSLTGASFRTYFKIEGTAKNLLTLRNQDPLLVSSDAGKSRIFMFASSADIDWNDLALTAAYVPLMHGLVKQAVGLTGTSLPPGIPFGEHFRAADRPIQMRGTPGGPGIYQFRLPAGDTRRGVNTPYAESDLAKVAEDALKKKFGAMDVTMLNYTEDGLKALQGGRKSLWPSLLMFLLAVLALEMILANGLRVPFLPKRLGK
ncbi:MAG: hypothetical protein ABII06_06640, partial [Pseudomonadota bacterium]